MTPQHFQRLLMLFAFILSLGVGAAAYVDLGGMRSSGKDNSLDFFTKVSPFEGDEDLARMMVLVDIDERSLKNIGQGPWPRSITGELIDRINAAVPLSIGLDILMTEEDRFTPQNIAKFTGKPPAAYQGLVPDGDAVLAASLQAAPTVMATNLMPVANPDPIFAPVGIAQIGQQNENLITVPGIKSPIPQLQTSPGAGFVSLSLERDNFIRKVPLMAVVDGQLVPSFALEMLRVGQGARGHVAKLAGDTGEVTTKVKTGRVIATADDEAQITLHHGYSDRFTTISAHTIMANDDGAGWAEAINNSFVIIGSTASGLKDIHATALEASLPGPYIHLQILHQILSERHIQSGHIVETLEIAGTVLASAVISLLMIKLPLALGFTVLVTAAIGAVYGFLRAFIDNGYLGNVFLVVGSVVVVSLLVLTLRAIYEEYRRRKLRTAFNQYLSPEMVRRIDASGSGPALDGQKTEISVMFMDVRGFTTLSEALADTPETLTHIINHIMDRATAIILDHGGTLDKYIGDALMAFWNAPMPQSDHARRAVDAAIALEAMLPSINQELKAMMGDRWPKPDGVDAEIRIGIGIATGDAVVGNLGSQFRFNYSCIGDIVNLAARLEPFGKNTGQPITVADTTATQSQHPDLLAIDQIAVRGKSQQTTVFSPVVMSAETRAIHDDLMASKQAAQKRKSTQALKKLGECPDYPDGLIAYYSAS